MAEFEELRLTVSLVDSASAGLGRIRTELGLLTQTAGQMAASVVQASQGVVQLASAAQSAAPKIQTISTEMRTLQRHAAETGRALGQMGYAAQQGLGGLPQLALGLYDAAGGVKGLGESLKSIAPAASSSAVALGTVALGITGIALAAVAYGISVFRFAKEMDQLGKTARSLGMSFAELKSAQDQAKAFGSSAEAIIRSFQGIQDAQLDLYKNNSQLRQKLLGQGVDANWVNQLAAADPSKARSMIADYGKRLQRQAEEAGVGKNVAAALRNQFYGEFGQNAADMELALKPVDPATEADMKRVEELSKNVADVWGEISLKLSKLSFSVLSAGLPVLLGTLRVAEGLFSGISTAVTFIDDGLRKLGLNLITVMKWIPGLGPVIAMVEGLYKSGGGKSEEAPSSDAPATLQERFGPFDKYQPSSFGGGSNDNNPLVHRASYSPGGGGTSSRGGGGSPEYPNLSTSYGSSGSAGSSGSSGGGGSTTSAPASSAAGPGGGGGTVSRADAQSIFGGGNVGVGGTVPQAMTKPAAGGGGPSVSVDGSMKGRVAGLQSLMGDVSDAGMTTTSGYRGPEHGLSRANPRSKHGQALAFDTRARTPEQVDAAMAKQRDMFAARGMVEGRDYSFIDEVRRPSGHATGPHLHTQLTPEGMQRYQTSKAAEQGTVAGVAAPAKVGGYPSNLLTMRGGGGIGFDASMASQPDRGALDRSALSDATTVRADGSVKVDVGPTAQQLADSARERLFAKTELQRSTAGQLTQSGPNAADTANQYMASR